MHNPLDTAVFDIITLNPTDGSAGANKTIAVPANSRIQPVSVQFLFTADANVANRRIFIEGFDGFDPVGRTIVNKNVTAGQAIQFYCSLGITSVDDVTSNATIYQQLAEEIYLRVGDSFVIGAINIQVGDVISDIAFRYKQWVEE